MKQIKTLSFLLLVFATQFFSCGDYCSNGTIRIYNYHHKGGKVYFEGEKVGEIEGAFNGEPGMFILTIESMEGFEICGLLEIDRRGFFTSDYEKEICLRECGGFEQVFTY
ncbi:MULTISPECIES: hypothetical protein [Flammeovirga]|uniref:DUF4369 domain-containing protein n=1 Tax=Flammeovirga agarivorans TaxID=2726742 RepID=A0A7X8SQG3_9BACT|nr:MULTISPECIES: hypothetical protein [Flammeovirga]NLR94431.1 hypothetical protein [Flammeovirga agarivorans]